VIGIYNGPKCKAARTTIGVKILTGEHVPPCLMVPVPLHVTKISMGSQCVLLGVLGKRSVLCSMFD